jgi:serralysin
LDSLNIEIEGESGLDQIRDFTRGEDKIDLSRIDAFAMIEGDQAFLFVTDHRAPRASWEGTVRITTDERGFSTMINISSDGDAEAEMQIYLPTAIALTADDFIL